MPNILIPFIKRLEGLKRKALFLALGCLWGLSAPGFNVGWLAWLGLAPALWTIASTDRKRTVAVHGFLFGAGFHLVYLCWYWGLYPLDWLGFSAFESRLIALAAWLLASLYGALFVSVLFVLYQVLNRKRYLVYLFPLVWVGLFQLFKMTDLGVPWAFVEYTQANLSCMCWVVAMIGGTGLGAIILFQNVLLARWAQRGFGQPYWLLLGPILVGLLAGFGSRLSVSPLPLTVAVIQGNLPIDVVRSEKLSMRLIEQVYVRPLQQHAFPSNTLVVLPEEGVIPHTISLPTPQQNPMVVSLQKLAHRRKLFIATGAITVDSVTRHTYNSLVLFSPDESVQFYHKRKLVPFGEYTPYLPESWIQQVVPNYSTGFNRGESIALLNAHGIPLAGLICFEAIYPELAQAYQAQGAQLMIDVSNLGWFHGNPWLEAQFLAMAQIRAAETHRPWVVAANTGVSAIISSQGQILQHAPSQTYAILMRRSDLRLPGTR